MGLWSNKKDLKKKLGLDALDSPKENFYQKMHNKKISVKDFLLEQSQIAGIGNIYACEILFDSKISPLKMSNKVSKKEAEKILQSINFILLLAIKKNGTSISDYRGIDFKTGEFQNFLKVYGKKNTPCFDCGKTIQKIKKDKGAPIIVLLVKFRDLIDVSSKISTRQIFFYRHKK